MTTGPLFRKLLLEVIGFKDPSGRSVIDIARANGHEDLAIRLRQLMSLPPSA